MSQNILRKQAFNKLKKYIENGSLDPSGFLRIIEAKEHKEIIKAFESFTNIDESKAMIIWRHYIYNKAKGVQNDQDRETVFDAEHFIFFKELLNKKGVLTREYCLDKIFKTPHICDTRAQFLEDLGLIDRIEINNYRVVYILNMDFYMEAFHGK